MQFRYARDFIVRKATGSDQSEVIALVQKYGDMNAVPSLVSNFLLISQNANALFKVAVNSNGIIIGFLYCTQQEWRELVVNPNFMKTDLKEALFTEAAIWAKEHAQGALMVHAKRITGDWKAFVKEKGCKMELVASGEERLFFP